MNRQVTVFACFASLSIGSASAGVIEIGEFTGEMSEGYEAIATPGGYPGAMPIFGGTAVMKDTLADFCVIALSWWGPGGEILPYNGNFMGGTVAGATLFEFTTPVLQFGGWVNTIATIPGGTATFRDPSGALIATVPVEITPATWGWIGWQSDTLIGSIEITTPNVPGFGLQFDDLHISSVPAPAALTLAGVSGLFAGRRRK